MPVEVDCDWCGEVTEKYPSRLDQENLFCSQDCRAEWQSETISGKNHPKYDRIKVSCDYCGDMKEETPSKVERNEHFFCDYQCRGSWVSENKVGEDHWEYDSINTECVFCGESLTRQKHRLEKHNPVCSEECLSKWISQTTSGEQSPHWKGGHGEKYYYGPNWQERREECLERDDFSCLRCGIHFDEHKEEYSSSLHIHHIIPFAVFGDNYKEANKLENLATLCSSCHHKVENLSPDEQKKVLFVGDN